MWVIMPTGMVSIVEKTPKAKKLCVRARCAADLDRLRDTYLPTLSATDDKSGSDYPFRAWAPREDVALAMAAAVRNIHYSNVKAETKRVLGADREGVMHRVWSALLSLEPPKKWLPKGDAVYDVPLFDDDAYDYGGDADDHTSIVTHCRVCSEEVPIFRDELEGVDMNDNQALVDAVHRIGSKVAAECQFMETGWHWFVSVPSAKSEQPE